MGCYINPPDMSKEEWLVRNGKPFLGPAKITQDTVPVCLVDNGIFTAAGVGFSEEEVEEFNNSSDRRPKTWYTVRREDVREVSDLEIFEKYFPPEMFPES